MDDYIKLIIFNIIIISLSFLFKKNIVLFYVFLLIFLLMFILTYMMILKNKLIEGNFQEELFESLDYVDSNKLLLRLPLDKISLILETMLEKLSGTKIENQNKCKGEFIINKLTNKTCGDGFNERVYKILDPGDGDCLHSELYKEKTPLKFCGYGEKCEKDLDCKSNRCNDELCDFELDCSETMLSGCKYDSCLALNSDLDKDLYFWSDNKCNVNPCNKNDFKMCDEGECNDLSYRFKYDKETKQCNEIVNEQGESTTEPESMNETYQRYTQAGGHEEICGDLNPGVESCSVGADLQPRYYCKGGYWNGEGEERGSKEPCVNAPGALERRWSADIVDAPTPDPIPSYIPPCVDYGQRSCPPCVTDANGQLCSNGTTRRNPGTGLCECQPCPPGYHGHNCNISQKCVDGQYLNEEKTGCVCDSSNGWYMLNGSCIECGDNQLLNEEKTGCVCDSSNGWGIDSDSGFECVQCDLGTSYSLNGVCTQCTHTSGGSALPDQSGCLDRTAHWVALDQIAPCPHCVTDSYWTTPVEAQCQWTDGIPGEDLHAPTNECREDDIDPVVTQFCELTTPACGEGKGGPEDPEGPNAPAPGSPSPAEKCVTAGDRWDSATQSCMTCTMFGCR